MMNLRIGFLMVGLIGFVGAARVEAEVKIESGFRVAEILGSEGLGPVAVISNSELIVASGFFGNQTLVRLNLSTQEISDFVLGVTDTDSDNILDGGISSVGDVYYDPSNSVIYFTDNFSFGTVFAAKDLNNNGTASDVIDSGNGKLVSEVWALAPNGTLPGASNIVRGPGSLLLVGNAAGNGTGTILAIDEINNTIADFASGFDFTAGIARHPLTGEIYVGNSSYPNPGQIYRLIGDRDSSGTIEISNPLEAEVIIAAVTGPTDLVFDADGTLFISTSASDIVQVVDTNNDNVPDKVSLFATGFAFSGSMDFGPADKSLNANQAGGSLLVTDPFAFGSATPTIKVIEGIPRVQLFLLDAFGGVRFLER